MFRCPPSGQIWHEENRNGRYPIFVFPRIPVRIHQAGRDAVVATPNTLMLYNPLQPYTRMAIDRHGDRCEYIGVNPGLLAEAYRECDVHLDDENAIPESDVGFAPFKRSHVDCDSRIYLAQRLLFCLLNTDDVLQPMKIEETFLALLPELVKCSNRVRANSSAGKKRSRRGKELSHATKEIVAQRFKTTISLESIAEELDCSVFHLCREFKRETGNSIHQSILRMRLFSSLEQLQDSDRSLTHIALDHQFSSHSHFTQSFRQMFGVTPASLRGRSANKYHRLLETLRSG